MSFPPPSQPGPLPFHPAPPSGPPAAPQPVRGPHFSYWLPPGWTVGEEGPFALVLRSADWLAGVVVFGQSGLMYPMAPDQFAHQAMAGVMRLAPDVRLFDARPVPPLPGYTQAARMETAYTVASPNGPVPIRGVVTSHVAIGYGTCGGTIALASSEAGRWPSYQGWLPDLASAARNTGPNAYGGASMGAGDPRDRPAGWPAHAAYRAWSESNWQGVMDERWRRRTPPGCSRADADRPGMDGRPRGNPAMRRSATPAAIRVSRDGREVHSDDPAFDRAPPTTPTGGGPGKPPQPAGPAGQWCCWSISTGIHRHPVMFL
ncbi:MAG: hypothetical protein U0800_15360 [Isosphaeraceae bacterium]